MAVIETYQNIWQGSHRVKCCLMQNRDTIIKLWYNEKSNAHFYIFMCSILYTANKKSHPTVRGGILNCLPFDKKKITQKGKRGIPFQSSIFYRLKIVKQCRMKCVTFILLITYGRKYWQSQIQSVTLVNRRKFYKHFITTSKPKISINLKIEFGEPRNHITLHLDKLNCIQTCLLTKIIQNRDRRSNSINYNTKVPWIIFAI